MTLGGPKNPPKHENPRNKGPEPMKITKIFLEICLILVIMTTCTAALEEFNDGKKTTTDEQTQIQENVYEECSP